MSEQRTSKIKYHAAPPPSTEVGAAEGQYKKSLEIFKRLFLSHSAQLQLEGQSSSVHLHFALDQTRDVSGNRYSGHNVGLVTGAKWPADPNIQAQTEVESLRRELESVRAAKDDQLIRAERLETQNRELRRQISQITRMADQSSAAGERLQDRLVHALDDRTQQMNAMLGWIGLKAGAKLLFTESYEGFVTEVSATNVTVVYETSSDEITHVYSREQFLDGKLPKVGDRIEVYVAVGAAQARPGEVDIGNREDLRGDIIRGEQRL